MNSRIILVAKGGAGKDYLKDKMVKRGFEREVSFTTRPKRPHETEGVDYHFISREQFQDMVMMDLIYQWDTFGGFQYGTSVQEWESKNLFIMTPDGVKKIKKVDRKHCFIIYLDIPVEIRMERLTKRSDEATAKRRIEIDEEAFKNFDDFDMRITNPEF